MDFCDLLTAFLPQGQPKQQLHNNPRPLFEKITRSLALSKDGKPPVPRNRDWYIRAEQTPDPAVEPIKPGSGKPTHISRDVVERLATEPDLDRFQVTDLYKFRHQYTIAGHQFVSGNIIVRVYRFHEEIHPNHPINRELFLPKESNLIDESGTWIVEALIRTEDTSNTKIVEAAKKELAFFRCVPSVDAGTCEWADRCTRSAMEGALDFYAPDRLALDTRVKGL